ncbi:unnamed protein product, partial [Hymenolepis diminuta]
CLSNNRLDHKANHICHLKGQKEDRCTLASSRTHKSSPETKSPKALDQCNRIREEPKSVFPTKRSALMVDDKCKEPGELDIAKPASLSRTWSDVESRCTECWPGCTSLSSGSHALSK